MPQGSPHAKTEEESWSRTSLFDVDEPARRHGTSEADERLGQLARAIELEIIPRLMLAHRAANECHEVRADARHSVNDKDVVEFAAMVLSQEDEVAYACVKSLAERGVTIESLYLDLLGPTARYLGELWTRDECDFTSVTIALGRLQWLLRELSSEFQDLDQAPPVGRRILLLPCPGEQHTFGLVMVSEFFRRAGWEVSGGVWEFGIDAANMVADDWYDVVGFSMGAECHVESLSACIRAVRQKSRNGGVVIMAGGPLFALYPELSGQIGADVVATDGKSAPALAEEIVARRGLVGA